MTEVGYSGPLPHGGGAPGGRAGIGNAGVDIQVMVTKLQLDGCGATSPCKLGGEYYTRTGRLHAFVFSDDEDDSQEHADWMSGVEVVRNRPPSFKVWLERLTAAARRAAEPRTGKAGVDIQVKVTKPQLEGCGATSPCPVARNDGMTW